jgi:putative ABC transport system ATP-binding protein
MAARINPDHDLLTGFPARETGKRLLEARNLVHVFGEGALRARALRGVSLALEGGNLTLLIGPSGSGKTTLLSILGCILTPTEGMIFVGGEAATGMPAERLALFRRHHIGYVFQSYNLFPTLTAEENVRVALDVRGLKGSGVAVASQKALQTVGNDSQSEIIPALEDMLSIFAEWDNPDDALASQGDGCIASLAEMFED